MIGSDIEGSACDSASQGHRRRPAGPQLPTAPETLASATRVAATPVDEIETGLDDSAAFIAALEDLEHALEANIDRARRMQARIAELRDAHAAGQPLREFVPREEQPLIVRLLSQSARELDEYGSVVRRMEARALYQEGLTMDEIAALFGVSRQRVSALLR